MKKSDFLKSIAEKGYDVGFGAKKHFATYDIIEKAPGMIGFISMAVGVFALAIEGFSSNLVSALFIMIGIAGLYISFYEPNKPAYDNSGVGLTKIFNELKALYFKVKNTDENSDFLELQKEFSEIESRYYPLCISKQIMFSNWYAHYKFFWEHQIDWINEQLNFGFFRDKVPLSLWFWLLIAILGVALSCIGIPTSLCKLLP